MPIYALKCHCGHREDIYRTLDERNNDIPDHCGRPMSRVISKPYVIEDMKPYISPLDGKVVNSRAEHRNKMVEHGVIELGNERLTRPATRKAELAPVEQDLHKVLTEAGL